MKKTLFAISLALALAAPAHAGCSYSKDKYGTSDKKEHAAIGTVIAFATTLGTESPWIGFAAGAAVGGLKELSDADGSGSCSGKDLAVTVAGAALGAFAGKQVLMWRSKGATYVGFAREF